MQLRRRWPDFVNLVLGLWLLCSPFTLGYDGRHPAAVNAIFFGLLIAAVALVGIFRYRPWIEVANAVLGGWVLLSAFGLGLDPTGRLFWDHLLVGAWVAAFALCERALMRPRFPQHHPHHRPSHAHGG